MPEWMLHGWNGSEDSREPWGRVKSQKRPGGAGVDAREWVTDQVPVFKMPLVISSVPLLAFSEGCRLGENGIRLDLKASNGLGEHGANSG